LSKKPTKIPWDSIRRVIEYDWDAEKKHYEEMQQPGGHIFEDLQKIRYWLLENDK